MASEPLALWPGLEVRHLQAFLAVADEGTFSRAAERLGYTQSAVSQQVRALEKMLGAELFDRPGGPRPVTLTPAGAAMEAHARAMVAQVVNAAAEIRALATGERGTLRVGTIQSVGRRILPELLRRFRASHPLVHVQLAEAQDPYVLLESINEGQLDMMFCPSPVPGGAFRSQVILNDPFVLLAPAGSPEASRSSITMDEVTRLPLIGYRSDWCRTLVADQLGTADFVFETDDNPTMQGLVGAGEAYAFISLLSIDAGDPDTVVVPIDPPVEPRQVAILQPSDRRPPPALAAFVETAEKVCADLPLSIG